MPRDIETAGAEGPAADLSVSDALASDPWVTLRPTTPARIGLKRSGDALALAHVLDLQRGHAKARDAVHVPMEADRIEAALAPRETIRIASRAPDRATYLRRPDLGREIDPAAVDRLQKGAWDVVFVIADGLSSAATEAHAVAVVEATVLHLDGWRIAPIVIATQARVALADDIGQCLGAALSVILIGERPGLSVSDSLGAYITFEPKRGRRDSERNCISNIHGAGLSTEAAAARLAWLLREARQRSVTGVGLKDRSGEILIEGGQKLELGG